MKRRLFLAVVIFLFVTCGSYYIAGFSVGKSLLVGLVVIALGEMTLASPFQMPKEGSQNEEKNP